MDVVVRADDFTTHRCCFTSTSVGHDELIICVKEVVTLLGNVICCITGNPFIVSALIGERRGALYDAPSASNSRCS